MAEGDGTATTRPAGRLGEFRLAGRVAVVTGASSGIGRAVALRLVAEGAQVTAVGRDKSRLDALPAAAAEITPAGCPGALRQAQADLTDDDARGALVAGLLAGPRVDILVHSAGGYTNGAHADAPLDDLDWLYAANVRAPYALTQELLPALRAGGGDVIVINSSQGLHAGPNLGQFAATQHAMRAVTDSLRQEINADGIRVCGVHPGRTATPRQEALFAQEGRAYRPDLLLAAEDVAEVVAGVLTLPANAEITEVHLRPAKKSY
ncbi:SDR family NAD(P)-dependent oxidoreductase [Frankia sp. AgB1.9]|uniref:SDR family NAD(P)-dependent oxidoreductase n=1 Tax=unclassified Frankia TaxID=2632575 RepID=UPI001931EF60|nr:MULTISPECIES: SDR family NAD(P)-dependent oxidoreductase [unclassified Frankia]MBL7487854.1 SDR family NAD(P)-dependent oxidoreductase [Frankia sp. AgW1.1]MBL7547166.1 SDR family NAD(P)-dependent oxidoreductase [Frankia sp. AgB1.9]MBL7620104.1 SDR family NAD(P)-dependent oxidoreductase [Frankia sp. AgB1.8]